MSKLKRSSEFDKLLGDTIKSYGSMVFDQLTNVQELFNVPGVREQKSALDRIIDEQIKRLR